MLSRPSSSRRPPLLSSLSRACFSSLPCSAPPVPLSLYCPAGAPDLTGYQPLDSLTRKSFSKPVLPSVSASLLVALGLGALEALFLSSAASPVLSVMGVSLSSPMHEPALQYLALRAMGAPAVVLALATQGVFRGFKDTRTPLFATGKGRGGAVRGGCVNTSGQLSVIELRTVVYS